MPVEAADAVTLAKLTSQYALWYWADDGTYFTRPMYSVWGRDQFYHAGGESGERYCQIRINEQQKPGDWPTTIDGCGGDSVLGQSFFEFCSEDQRSPVLDFFDALPMFPSDLPLRELESLSYDLTWLSCKREPLSGTLIMPASGGGRIERSLVIQDR